MKTPAAAIVQDGIHELINAAVEGGVDYRDIQLALIAALWEAAEVGEIPEDVTTANVETVRQARTLLRTGAGEPS